MSAACRTNAAMAPATRCGCGSRGSRRETGSHSPREASRREVKPPQLAIVEHGAAEALRLGGIEATGSPPRSRRIVPRASLPGCVVGAPVRRQAVPDHRRVTLKIGRFEQWRKPCKRFARDEAPPGAVDPNAP